MPALMCAASIAISTPQPGSVTLCVVLIDGSRPAYSTVKSTHHRLLQPLVAIGAAEHRATAMALRRNRCVGSEVCFYEMMGPRGCQHIEHRRVGAECPAEAEAAD